MKCLDKRTKKSLPGLKARPSEHQVESSALAIQVRVLHLPQQFNMEAYNKADS